MNNRSIHDLPKEIFTRLVLYLSLRDILSLSLTSKKYFEIIKNTDIIDPYLEYVLLTINKNSPMPDDGYLKNIYRQNNNKPLLVQYGDKMKIYQFSLPSPMLELNPLFSQACIECLYSSKPSAEGERLKLLSAFTIKNMCEEEAKLYSILKNYASTIKFKNILELNRERKLRLNKINELNLKHSSSMLNAILNTISSRTVIEFSKRLTSDDILNLLLIKTKDVVYFSAVMACFFIAMGVVLTDLPIIPPAVTVTAYCGTIFYAGKKLIQRIAENNEIENLENQNILNPDPFI